MSLPDPVELASRRLREAHELLREEPSSSVRAKVLQAAAQHHRPTPAEAAVRLRPRFGLWSWLHGRPPLAIGATVVVGVLAVGVALQVDRVQVKSDNSVIPRSTRTGPIPAPPAAPAPEAAQPPPAPPATATVKDESSSARRDSLPAANQASHAAATRSSKAPPAAALAPRPASVPQSDSSGVPMGGSPLSKPSSQRQASGPTRLKYQTTPQEWLKRIVELRNAHRDAEADDELMRFKAVYPDATIPEDARPR